MNTKFTKGEWIVEDDGRRYSIWSKYGENDEKVIDEQLYSYPNKEYSQELKANAHLMATAPDMYAEIQSDIEELEDKLLDVSKVSGDYDFIVGRIKHKESLLAKARGEL